MAALPPGKLGDIYESLADEEREDYLETLASRSVPAERLAALLRAKGFPVSPSLIRTHRREREIHERLRQLAQGEHGPDSAPDPEGGERAQG